VWDQKKRGFSEFLFSSQLNDENSDLASEKRNRKNSENCKNNNEVEIASDLRSIRIATSTVSLFVENHNAASGSTNTSSLLETANSDLILHEEASSNTRLADGFLFSFGLGDEVRCVSICCC
jgi:hypothetical protein